MKILIYRPGSAQPEERDVQLAANPSYQQLRDLITPLLDGGDLEHVSVLFEGRRADMFVDELGHVKNPPLRMNKAATAIYRASKMKQQPHIDPEELNWIAGPAIVFSEIVWK